MYPKNAWYVACTPDEIADKPLGRTICGEKIVFYRPAPDQVAALDDFCPHRGAPLSLGTVCEGHLQCGYHGLRVECTGKSVSMPGQRVQGFPKARSFPVVERYGFIWVWPGDADKADPATIHHLPWANNPEWAYGGGLYHIACDYRLMIDNLMDLTHETYVHSTSIGQKEIDEVPCKTRVEGDEVITSRFMEGIEAPPFWKMALRMNGLPDDQPVDRWQICHFTPPQPCADRGGRGDGWPRWLQRPGRQEGIEHRGGLHHARDRNVDPLLLGHGAQLQATRPVAHHPDPRRPGQDLCGGPADAGAAAGEPAALP